MPWGNVRFIVRRPALPLSSSVALHMRQLLSASVSILYIWDKGRTLREFSEVMDVKSST